MGRSFWGRGVAAGCAAAGALIVGVAPALGGAFPAATNGRIVYSNGGQIMTANPDGTSPVQLTNYNENVAAAFFPRWSADGKEIVYRFESGTTVSIDVMNADGSNQRAVFTGSDATVGSSVFPSAPSFSPDGTRIVFEEEVTSMLGSFPSGSPLGLYTMGSDGSNPTKLNITNLNSNQAYDPQYSPDGTEIAFSGVQQGASSPAPQIAVVPAGGGAATFLTSNGQQNSWPDFSPDGSKIVWEQENNFGGTGEIDADLMNSNGSGQTTLVADSFAPTFSPDGSKVMLGSSTRAGTTGVGNNFLYTVNAAGGGLTDTGLVADLYAADWGSAPLRPSASLAPKSVSVNRGIALHCSTDGTCDLLGTLTTVEHRIGSKIVSITKAGRLAMTKVKRRHELTVTVGLATLTIPSGGNGTLHLKLTAIGRKLLKQFGKVPVDLTITLTNETSPPAIARLSGTFKK